MRPTQLRNAGYQKNMNARKTRWVIAFHPTTYPHKDTPHIHKVELSMKKPSHNSLWFPSYLWNATYEHAENTHWKNIHRAGLTSRGPGDQYRISVSHINRQFSNWPLKSGMRSTAISTMAIWVSTAARLARVDLPLPRPLAPFPIHSFATLARFRICEHIWHNLTRQSPRSPALESH